VSVGPIVIDAHFEHWIDGSRSKQEKRYATQYVTPIHDEASSAAHDLWSEI
jgi:hypothetical protein